MFFFRDFSNTFSDGAVVFPQHNFIIRTFNGNLLGIARVCQEIEMIFGDDEIGIISGVSTDVADVLFFLPERKHPYHAVSYIPAKRLLIS